MTNSPRSPSSPPDMTTESGAIHETARGAVRGTQKPVGPGPQPRVVAAPERTFTRARIVTGVISLLIVAFLVVSMITAPAMEWSTVGQYVLSSIVLEAVLLTIELTVISMAIAIVIGTVLAMMIMSKNPVFRWLANIYIWFFRGVPALVQLLLWYNLALLFPHLSIGIPFVGPNLVSVSTNSVMTPLFAAIIGLALHESAFMCDVVRSGLMSVERGQREAATALGLTKRQIFIRIVLPQSMRVMVPNTGNRMIGQLKFTSLASFLAVQELLYTVQSVYNRTLQTIPLLMVATVWYLFLVSLLTLGQRRLERYYMRDLRGSSGSAMVRPVGDAES